MRSYTQTKLTLFGILFYGMSTIVQSQPTTMLIPADNEYLPGTVVSLHKNQIASEIIPHTIVADHCCLDGGLSFEDSEKVQDFVQVYSKKEKEFIIKDIFRPAFGLPMDPELKAITTIQLAARSGQSVRFGSPIGNFAQLTSSISCQGLEAIRNSIGRERNLFYVKKFYNLKETEWSFRWKKKPDREMRSNVEVLLDDDKIFRHQWNSNGHMLVSPRNVQPYWVEIAAFDKKTVLQQIQQRLLNGNCNCRVLPPEVSNIESINEIPGLALFYPFNYTAQDEGLNGYHGEINQTTFVNGRKPTSAGIFIPGHAHFKIPEAKSIGINLLLNGSFSISFWMMDDPIATSPSEKYPIFHKTDISHLYTPYNGIGLYKHPSNGLLSLEMSDKEDYPRPTNTKTLQITFQPSNVKQQQPQWHHYVLTIDRFLNHTVLYQDGKALPILSKKGLSPKAISISNEAAFSIGQLGPLFPVPQLSIDDLAIFNRALTQTEVIQLGSLD